MAEYTAHALVRVDNAQQHAQRGGLARAIGAENAVDRAFRNSDIDPVDRRHAVEAFHQAPCLDGEGACDGTGHESIHDTVIAPGRGLA